MDTPQLPSPKSSQRQDISSACILLAANGWSDGHQAQRLPGLFSQMNCAGYRGFSLLYPEK